MKPLRKVERTNTAKLRSIFSWSCGGFGNAHLEYDSEDGTFKIDNGTLNEQYFDYDQFRELCTEMTLLLERVDDLKEKEA